MESTNFSIIWSEKLSLGHDLLKYVKAMHNLDFLLALLTKTMLAS